MKKIAIIGRGTAGALSAAHFKRWCGDCNIDWYFDPNIKPQAVGEGSTALFPDTLFNNLGFKHSDLPKLDGTFKYGIFKKNWGIGNQFTHHFVGSNFGYHFNATRLQEYILARMVEEKINIIEKNVVDPNDLDADFIMDCSGKPSDFSTCQMSEYIPVNSVYVNQCFWDYPRFEYTLAIARPYGWVFGIPLQNRCSIGYMYNNTINTLEEIKEDVKIIFSDYNLTPSDATNAFTFKNYYRNNNFTNKVIYNGNASFFLEPLEATSIQVMDYICRVSYDVWFGNLNLETANSNYKNKLKEIETMIMLHYHSGSIFKTKFWEYAQTRGSNNIKLIQNEPRFIEQITRSKYFKHGNNDKDDYGGWPDGSWQENLIGLGIDYKEVKI